MIVHRDADNATRVRAVLGLLHRHRQRFIPLWRCSAILVKRQAEDTTDVDSNKRIAASPLTIATGAIHVRQALRMEAVHLDDRLYRLDRRPHEDVFQFITGRDLLSDSLRLGAFRQQARSDTQVPARANIEAKVRPQNQRCTSTFVGVYIDRSRYPWTPR